MAAAQTAMSRIGGWLAVLSIGAGILYVLYVLYWSGDEVAAFELEPRGRTDELAVRLDPAMTPVRAILSLDYSGRRGGRIASYDVAIGGDAEAGIKDIFTESGIANDTSDDTSRSSRVRTQNINLGSFEVPLEAGYLLRAEIAPSGRVDVEAARMTLAANSAVWDARIIAGLVGAMVLGFGLGVAGRRSDG
ncbi:hypothetical protein P1J78_15425 [Psychromarinibacter sp. C21-152]|uniref:Uncharacterized protein n=1 Tax=Psychromarinibacter sediminicola TaxID=3033385 RepID=A0AAE3NWB5_9RHOB|nr:hypothetical protein [Psychromarinibacter sediminicola]MDF0602130.1 hypothetical protein [Psychromarinibacter sediminicola]